VKFKVELQGAKEISDLLKRVPKEKEAEVKAEVGDIALKIQARAKAYLRTAPAMDTGNLANTILAEFSPKGIEAEIGPTAKYGIYIEFGAGPAVGHKKFFPPPDALESWARHHGFDSAWPVCKAIYERGLKPRPYLTPAYDDFSGELVIRIERVLGKEWK
jgi:hypothetical protein